jgi:hypothetical protein
VITHASNDLLNYIAGISNIGNGVLGRAVRAVQ